MTHAIGRFLEVGLGVLNLGQVDPEMLITTLGWSCILRRMRRTLHPPQQQVLVFDQETFDPAGCDWAAGVGILPDDVKDGLNAWWRGMVDDLDLREGPWYRFVIISSRPPR